MVARLQRSQLLAQLVLGHLQALRTLNRTSLFLVLDQLTAVLDRARARPLQSHLGRQVLARLNAVLVARIRLQRALVVLERLLGIAQTPGHRPGTLQAFGVLGRNLRQKLVDRARRIDMPRRLQRHAQQQIGLFIQRTGVEVGLVLLDGGIVLAGLGQALGRDQRTGTHQGAEQLGAAAFQGLPGLQRAAQTRARLTQVRRDVQQLPVQLDGEVRIAAPQCFVRLLELFGEVHGMSPRT